MLLVAVAHALADRRRMRKAEEYCRAALALNPDLHEARIEWGRINLLTGRWREAWKHRSRPAKEIMRLPKGMTGRAWEGQDLAGQSILLWDEQGMGDLIQYIRYVPLLAKDGAKIILACGHPRVFGLLRRIPGIDRIQSRSQPAPRTDWHGSLLDVPGIRGDDMGTVPSACPYLPPMRRKRPVLRPARQFRVGIVWAGNMNHIRDHTRSCRLQDFAPMFDLNGVEFVSFQVGPRVRELRSGWQEQVHDPGSALEGLESTADALMEVDLVITVDTMLAHLAGALGRPVWNLLAFNHDSRWMVGRSYTPWYPTMRLFRQPKPNDWASVFQEVRGELIALIEKS